MTGGAAFSEGSGGMDQAREWEDQDSDGGDSFFDTKEAGDREET